MIEYKVYSASDETIEIADGFFEGWPDAPDKNIHRQLLKSSFKAIVAIDRDINKIIGFITVISDGIISAYIPLLEVIPEYRKKGIGSKLFNLAKDECKNLYMIDLSCDNDLVEFYKNFNMEKGTSMFLRNYDRQSCK